METKVLAFCVVAIMMMVVAPIAPQAVAAMEDFSGFATGNFYQQIVEFDPGWSPANTTLWGGAFHRMASGIIVDLGGTGGNALKLQNVVTGATNPMPSFASPDLGLGNGVITGGYTTFYYSLRFRSSDDVRPTFASGQGYNINTTIRSQLIPGAGVARSGCLQFRDNSARDAEAGNTYTVRAIGYDTDWVSFPTSTFLPTYGTWYQAFMTYHSNPGFRDDTVDYVIKDELGNTLWSELGQPGWEGAYYDASGNPNWMPDLGYGLPELTGIAFNVNYLPPGNDYDSYPGGIYLDNVQWTVTLGTINVLKFFDPNGNGIQDSGEVPMPGWTIKLMKMDSTGAYNVVSTDTTDPQGEVSFADLESGTYAVTEEYPGLTWTKITRAPGWCDWQTTDGKYLFTKASLDGGIFNFDKCGYAGNAPRVDGIVVDTDAHDIKLGNVALKIASGGYSVSDWYRKNNNWLNNHEPAWRHLLNGFCLVGPTGSSFDVSLKSRSGDSDFKTWLQKAQAVNMAYALSAQLAATALNTHFRGLDPDTAILLPVSLATCYGSEFVTIADVMAAASAALCNDRYTPKGDPNRALQECLANILAGINSNSFRFLSPTPQR